MGTGIREWIVVAVVSGIAYLLLAIAYVFLGERLERLVRRGVRRDDPVIDPNEKCPACGGRRGTLCTVRENVTRKLLVRHVCGICGARWFSAPLLKDPDGTRVHAAVVDSVA